MELKLKIDLKVFRKAFAVAEMDIPSDVEIEDKFKDFALDLDSISDDEEMKKLPFALALMSIGVVYDK